MSKQPPVSALTRLVISELLTDITIISTALGHLEYRHAAPVLDTLKGLADAISETLPGGFHGRCERCDEAIAGEDDFVTTDDGDFCPVCVEEAAEDRAND